MEKIFNGGFGECIVLKKKDDKLLLVAPDSTVEPYITCEDYNEDFNCWHYGHYFNKLEDALADFEKR